MHVNNITVLRDALYKIDRDDRAHLFDMTEWGHQLIEKAGDHNISPFECNTPACIAGWTVAMLGDSKSPNQDIPETARDILCLTDDQALDLFQPGEWQVGTPLDTITPVDAAIVLDNLIATGEVNWSEKLRLC